MGPGSYATRYRHRVSARLLPRPARRPLYRGGATIPADDDAGNAWDEYYAQPVSVEDILYHRYVGQPDADERLRGADADPDPDRAAGAGEQDGGDDRGGERVGDSEGATTRLWLTVDRHADDGLHVAYRIADDCTYAVTVTYVPDPDPRGNVPTDIGED